MALGDTPKVPEFGTPPPTDKKDKKKNGPLKEILSFVKTLFLFLLLAFFLRASIVEAYKIPSGP